MKIFNPILLVFLSLNVVAQTPAQDSFATKAKILKVFLDKNHYSPVKWNDSTSARLYSRWMQLLDNDKILFTQQDINELQAYRTLLDDELNGNTSLLFYKKSVLLLKKAMLRSDSLQKAILAKPLDYSKPETIHYPFKQFAGSVVELQQRFQQLYKWRILRSIVTAVDGAGELQKYTAAAPADFAAKEIAERSKIKKNLKPKKELTLSENDFLKTYEDHYLQAISWCYDPHSTYMNLADKKDFTTELSGFEYSTGMNLQQDDDGKYEVESLEPGGSAWRSAELHKGDKVVKIKKGKVEKELDEMDEDEVDELLKGSSDEEVEVTVATAAGTTKVVKLTKEKVTDDEGIVKSYLVRAKQNIGYIQLPGFYTRENESAKTEADITYDGCAGDVSKEIIKLKKDSIEGLILDMRYNGGGSMWEAMQLAGIFIDFGPVASVKEKSGKVRFLKDPNRGTIYDGPLLVLVNGSSASASELTSAVLQDYNRALIVGATTYGKGTAQSILPLDTLYSEQATKNYDRWKDFVKVTGEKFYRVNGSTTQWQGVVPQIQLPYVSDGNYRESKVLSALLPDESKKGMYNLLPVLPVDNLKEKSNRRVQADSLFSKINAINKEIEMLENGRDIPLQWNSYILFYKKAVSTIKSLQQIEDSDTKKLVVSNNNFDSEKIKFASASGKKLNEAYLSRIAADIYINEAVNILQDWINK